MIGLALLAGCATGDSRPIIGPSLMTIQAKASVAGLGFTGDSRSLLHLDSSGSVRFFDVFAGQTTHEWKDEHLQPQVVVGGRGDLFAVASGQRVWLRRRGGVLVAEYQAAAAVAFLLIDEQSRALAVADVAGMVDVYDIASKDKLRTLRPEPAGQEVTVQPGAGFGVMYLHPGGLIQTVSCDATVPPRSFALARRSGSRVCISADGRRIASFHPEGGLQIHTMSGDTAGVVALSVPWEVESMQLSPDGSVLAVANQHVGVWLWDTAENEELDRFDSRVWTGMDVVFSPRGNFLAWVERDHRIVRFWSPARGVEHWVDGKPRLVEAAKDVCRNLADEIRFRRATVYYERGKELLGELRNDEALESFKEVAAIMPTYPGLSTSRAKAEERREARIVSAKLAAAEVNGDYRVALRLLESFLQHHAKFDDYGFRKRARTLREMIEHLDAADEHRKAGREVDAVIEFELAVKVVPELEDRNAEFVELRKRLLESLEENARSAFSAKDYLGVIKATESLSRLRELSGEATMRLGVSHELLGNPTQAEKAYKTVKPGVREFVAARRSIARIARVAGDFAEARRHLELARADVVEDVSLEAEYAEVCQLCKDYDAAVEAWQRVGRREQQSPEPYANIATIEEIRERWEAAAAALKIAIERSKRPRPRLQVRMATVLRKAGGRENVVEIYKQLLEVMRAEPELVAFLGSTPQTTVENWIRDLDYVFRRKEWIKRSQFFEEQGWENHDGRWLRPREARLREVAERYKSVRESELRAFSDERYRSYARERRITKGMNRREVIGAWGFFKELTVFESEEDKVVFEQLTYDQSRKVFLRDGLVCYWSE